MTRTLLKIESKTEEGGMWVSAYIPNSKALEKRFENGLAVGWLEIDDGRGITSFQRKFIYALLKDISIHTSGYCDEVQTAYYKGVFKYMMLERELVHDYFSLSNCTMTIANKMIDLIIDTAFEYNIPLSQHTVDMRTDEERWQYYCLKYRKCCICGKKADVHHALGSKVQMGHNRDKIDNTDREFIALCRIHHNMIEAGKEMEFREKYHIKPIRLTGDQIKELNI